VLVGGAEKKTARAARQARTHARETRFLFLRFLSTQPLRVRFLHNKGGVRDSIAHDAYTKCRPVSSSGSKKTLRWGRAALSRAAQPRCTATARIALQLASAQPPQPSQVKALCAKAKEILMQESNVQPVRCPVTVRAFFAFGMFFRAGGPRAPPHPPLPPSI
jgi:hypothetical protein